MSESASVRIARTCGVAGALLCLGIFGCSSGGSPPDAASADAGPSSEAGTADAGRPATLVVGLPEPVSMRSDGTSLFVIDGNGRLFSIPVGGGSTTTLVASKAEALVGVDEQNVYFIGNDGLDRIPKGGGAPSRISDGQAYSAMIRQGVAYWIQDEGSPPVSFLKTAPLSGGAPIVLYGTAEAPLVSVTATADAVFVIASTGPKALPKNGVPDGGSLIPVPYPGPCADLFGDDDDAYCLPAGKGPLARLGSDGSVTTIVDTNATQPAVALDGSYVYFTDMDLVTRAYALLRVPKLGGQPSVVYSDGVAAIAVDDAGVYWEYQGRIMRVAK